MAALPAVLVFVEAQDSFELLVMVALPAALVLLKFSIAIVGDGRRCRH